MPIRSTIHHLPERANAPGVPPSKNPFVANAVTAAFDKWYTEQGFKTKDPAIPDAGPYRGSMASQRCDRQLYYSLVRAEPSNPPTIATYWTWFLGQMVHEKLQPIINDVYPGVAEMNHDLRPIGIPGSAHSDFAVTTTVDEHAVMIEIKSINGFGFKSRATTFGGAPDGPAYGAVLQALLSAEAEGIDRVVVVLVSLECVSPNLASWLSPDNDGGRFMAEWHFSVAEMKSQLDAEKARIAEVLDTVELNEAGLAEHGEDAWIEVLPPRRLRDPEYPDGAVITNPSVTRNECVWVVTDGDPLGPAIIESGTYWGCGYCPQLDRCKEDGA